jgi:hypothetical protein
MLDVETILKRYQKAKSEYDENRCLFEEVINYVNPFKNTYNGNSSHEANESNTLQHDSTPLVSSVNFINTLSKKFTPQFTRWVELEVGPGMPDQYRNLFDTALEALNELIFSFIETSNYAAVKPRVYFDLGIGTGCYDIVKNPDPLANPLLFIDHPLTSLSLVSRADGFINMKFIDKPVKCCELKELYGGKLNLTAKLEKDVSNSKDGNREIKLVEVVYWDDLTKLWYFEVIYPTEKHSMLKVSDKECMRITPRWLTIPGQSYGIGPFTMALSDIRQLNSLTILEQQSAAFSTFGAYTVAGMDTFNPTNWVMQPMSFFPVERNGGPDGPSIAPFPNVGNFQAQEFMITGMKDQIRQIMLDRRLPPETAQPKTAFEIAERMKELETDIGAALPQLYYEDVMPAVRRIVSILQTSGHLDAVLQPLLGKIPNLSLADLLNGFALKVKITSPISRLQSVQDVQAFSQAFSIIQGILPEISTMSLNLPKTVHWIFQKLGAPNNLLLPEQELQQLQQQLQDAAAQGAAQVQMQNAGV